MNGGYDNGYEKCPCFWGTEPGSLIRRLEHLINDFNGLEVIDIGCGEGKNAVYLAERGANVFAIDISEKAIKNAKLFWGDNEKIRWEIGDVRQKSLGVEKYDIVVAYGLLHCFSSKEEIENVVNNIQKATKKGGINILCAFNDRSQDLSAHPFFNPTILKHAFYLELYSDFEIVYESDEDLIEKHPHNNVLHKHSMTRLIARKV